MNIENMVKIYMELLNFVKKEPFGFAGSMNFYGYCEGDPVNFVDCKYEAKNNIDTNNPLCR